MMILNRKLYIILATVLLGNGYLFAQSEACEKVLNDGTALFNSGKYSEAKAKFEAAKRINCDHAQSWIDKCNTKLTTHKPTTNTGKSSEQIQCEELFKDAKEVYDEGEYEIALILFEKGLDDICSNVDFRDYIDLCNMKIEKQQGAEQKDALCNKRTHFATNIFRMAKALMMQKITLLPNCTFSLG